MNTFKIGDTVKVVDLHEQDAYYSNRHQHIGTIGIIKRLNPEADAPEGFLSGDFEMGEDTRCFFAVKLELVEAVKPAKRPTHLSCKRWFKGETHFSSKLFFSDGTSEKLTVYDYGYGEHCIHDSVERMKELGYLQSNKVTFNSHQDLSDAGISYEIMDVAHKGDL
jgi:hypothetical protein